MRLSRAKIVMTAASVVAVVSLASLGYDAWREFVSAPPASSRPAPPPSATSRPTPSATSRPTPSATSRPAPLAAAPASKTAENASEKPVAPTVTATGIPAPTPTPTRAAPASALAAPSFDIVRVEPTGEAVVAGRARPGGVVTLLDNGTPLQSARADANGQFAMTPRLKPGPHQLTLAVKMGQREAQSLQSVAVATPEKPSGPLVVALARPGEATQILAEKAPGAALGKKKPDSGVAIRTVETGQDGNFFASGAAAPGARLRLYLNNAPIASVTADISGAWSLRVEHGLKPGSYEVRADAISPADGSVLARAAAPFVFQGFAGARASDRSKVAKAGPSAGAAVVSIATVEVARGDNLWRISRHILGRGMRYTLIYEANASQIRDRNLIYPGQIFVIPKS